MVGMETRRVDKDKLCVFGRIDSGGSMASCLRLARRDAYFLSDESVQQSGLADVGAPDDSNHSAPETRARGIDVRIIHITKSD